MTDRPRPPQPPANDDLEAPREVEAEGLRGIGRRIGEVLRGHLEKTEDESKPPAANRPIIPAEKVEVQVQDDD
jgi:hypothetical protein